MKNREKLQIREAIQNGQSVSHAYPKNAAHKIHHTAVKTDLSAKLLKKVMKKCA